MSGATNLSFSVDANGNISGSGTIFGPTQKSELKGKVHGRSIEIKAYWRGSLKAKFDLSFKISSGKNILSGTMLDDDYTFNVYLTGKKI